MQKDIIDSINEEASENTTCNYHSEIKDFIINLSISLALAITFTSLINITIISGQSMYPTLHNKQVLVMEKATKIFNKLERGDIISFKARKEADKDIFFIKRIIGIPGDIVEITNGRVFVNGALQQEEFLPEGILTGTTDGETLKIHLNDEEYFVLGDNRNNSVDSRFEEVGVVKKEQIVSSKLFSIYPGEK